MIKKSYYNTYTAAIAPKTPNTTKMIATYLQHRLFPVVGGLVCLVFRTRTLLHSRARGFLLSFWFICTSIFPNSASSMLLEVDKSLFVSPSLVSCDRVVSNDKGRSDTLVFVSLVCSIIKIWVGESENGSELRSTSTPKRVPRPLRGFAISCRTTFFSVAWFWTGWAACSLAT